MSRRLSFKNDIVPRIMEKWEGQFTILEDIDEFDKIYKNVHQHISVKCNKCGKIYKGKHKKRINDLLHNYGCDRCANVEKHEVEEWIDIINEETKGEYTLIPKENQTNKIVTRDMCTFRHNDPNCKNKVNDGIFEKKLHNFITNEQYCPFCQESFMGIKDSKGILKIKSYLDERNISYESEYKFQKCRSEDTNRLLPFDIYVESFNILIEFDGIHHFKPVEVFGGEEEFKKRVKNDKTKNKFAKDNGIELLRISYNEIDNIDNIMRDKFGE